MKLTYKELSVSFLFILIFTFALNAQDKSETLDKLISSYTELGQFNGSVLVADKGKVIFEKGYGYADMEWQVPNTVDTKFELGSVTKQFTAALILQLNEEGKLKLDDKVSDILSWYPAENGSRITIHQLLTHTSGIPNYTSFPDFVNKRAFETMTPRELISTFSDKPLDFNPGTKFSYSNSGYIVLGAIIEKVTGKSYEEVLKEKILKPIGMENSGYINLQKITPKRAHGYSNRFNDYSNAAYLDMSLPFAAGALYSTVEDLFKWDQALYGEKILSAENKEKMFTGYVDDSRGDYGYGWEIAKETVDDKGDSTLSISHGGSIFGFSSLIVRLPENKQLVVLLNNTDSAPLNKIYTGIKNILYDQPFEQPEKSLINEVVDRIDQKGIDAGISFYKEKEKADPANKIAEAPLNALGYYFMRSGRLDDAVKIFKLNMEEYPESFNVYDSYAEALMNKGDNEGAIVNYKKSIALDSHNKNAYDQLEKMGVKLDRPAERTAVEVDPAIFEDLAGEYQLQPGFVITVTSDEDKIYAQATGQPRFEIFAESETEYFLKVVDARVTFVKDENGSYSKLILHQNGRDMPAERIK